MSCKSAMVRTATVHKVGRITGNAVKQLSRYKKTLPTEECAKHGVKSGYVATTNT